VRDGGVLAALGGLPRRGLGREERADPARLERGCDGRSEVGRKRLRSRVASGLESAVDDLLVLEQALPARDLDRHGVSVAALAVTGERRSEQPMVSVRILNAAPTRAIPP